MDYGIIYTRGETASPLRLVRMYCKEDLSNQNSDEKGEERMYPDTYKEKRKRRIDRNRTERYYEDTVKEKRVKRPRKKNIKYYEYNVWNE